jgi:hypothetical protein
VARGARHVGVARGQRKSRGVVIEGCRGPADGRVAGRAIRQCECGSSGRMHGIGRRLPGG